MGRSLLDQKLAGPAQAAWDLKKKVRPPPRANFRYARILDKLLEPRSKCKNRRSRLDFEADQSVVGLGWFWGGGGGVTN